MGTANTVIGLMAVGSTRVYHIHGIPWFYGRGCKEVVGMNMPLEEGTLMVLGGPLRERWLYAQPRDEEMLPERIQLTLQLHADIAVAKGRSPGNEQLWTEDCDGTRNGDSTACDPLLLAAETPGTALVPRVGRWQRRVKE